MDELDPRLHDRLAALADSVPISAESTRPTRMSARLRSAGSPGFLALATAAGVVLIVVLGVGVASRGAPPAGASPALVGTPSPAATGTGAPTPSPAPTAVHTPAPSAVATRPPAEVALPYPGGCEAYGLSPRRCAYIVDWALAEAGVPAEGATVQLLGDPECEGQPADCSVTRAQNRLGGGWFVVRVRVLPANGSPSDHPITCGIMGDTSLLCTDTPWIRVNSPMSGYHDVPCGAEPAPGGCASPVPPIAASAAANAVGLRVPTVTIIIDHAGTYTVDLGDAVLPNGILTKASAMLADNRRADVLIPKGIRLEVVGEDGKLLLNGYDHGWRPGTERVHVRLRFTVESFDAGATLEITDVLVR